MGIVEAARADGTYIGRQHRNAVRTLAPRPVHGGRIHGVACSSAKVRGHPDVEVTVARPIDQVFHVLVPLISEDALGAGNAVGAIAVGIELRQFEGEAYVRHDVKKLRLHVGPVRGLFVEILVHHTDGIAHLFIADVLRAVVVNDVEDNGNDVCVATACGINLEMGGVGLHFFFRLSDLRDSFRMAFNEVPHAGEFVVPARKILSLGRNGKKQKSSGQYGQSCARGNVGARCHKPKFTETAPNGCHLSVTILGKPQKP